MTTATAGSLRAIAFTATELAELIDWPPDPAPLGADEVTGRTLVTLASPGTELNGYLAERAQPVLSGYASVFAVDGIGAGVRDLRPGDIVFAMGPHASRQRVHRSLAVPVPHGLDPAVAVFCRLMGVGWSTLTTTAARPPDRVLVTGLGPVGNLAAQVFSAAGYEVTAVDPVPARRELAARHGLRDLRASAEQLGEEFALAVECSGHERAVLDAIEALRKRGEVALVGVPWKPRSDLGAHALLHAIFHRYVVLRSGWEWEVPMHPRDFAGGSIIANWAAGLRWLADGRVRVDGLASTVSPKDAQRVWQDLLHQRGTPTVVFDWTA